MADLRLASVDRTRVVTDGASWDGRGRRDAYQRPKGQQRTAKERLVSVLAPGKAAEACEVDYVVDGNGLMVAVLVRDAVTGETLARINAEDLWQLGAEEAAGGILLERKG
jgi:hypothetical protein